MVIRNRAMRGLEQAAPENPFAAVQQQYTEPQNQYFRSIGAVSPGSAGIGLPDLGVDVMAQSNPQWARWFDTIRENVGDTRFAPQPPVPGSNQFRGISANLRPTQLNRAVIGLQDFQK